MTVRKSTSAVLLTAFALTLGACAESERSDDGSGGGSGGEGGDGTFTFGAAGAPEVFDPFYASDGETFRITRQIFEGLVEVKPGSAEIGPGLATEWEPNEDGTKWTFTLRDGVTFSDGEEMNAEAICANFERMADQNETAQAGPAEYWAYSMEGFGEDSLYRSCEATDDMTVDLTIARPTSKFPALLSLSSFAMQSPKALEEGNANEVTKQGEGFSYPENAQNPVGTGPYTFEKYDTANKTVTLKRNDDYWGEKAKNAEIVFKIIPDESTRRQELEADSINGYDLPNPVDWKGLEDGGNQVEVRPAFNILYMGLNPERNEKLQDKKVREAIGLALDREGMVKAQLPEGAVAASQFMPDTVQGYNSELQPTERDVEKAKSLLKEAGAEDLELTFAYPSEVTRPYMPNPQKIHEALTNNLEEVGITVKAVTKPWNGGYLDGVDNGQFDAWLLGWTGDYDSADNFIGTFFGNLESNDFQTSATDFGEQLSQEIKEADQTVDEAERTAMYEELNKKIAEEYIPGLPISHSPPAIVVNEDVEGLVASPLTAEEFSTVTVGGK
ncbi:ABC transporter substrate-binding protein [Marihabitans asiaticum]|uniref:Peptide/nickel transport system substrate-binding protein n=1 Tax=Marihabitans asiaticum TaxID=415218 RepID=A0A560WI34_9MICO|nr:ABC transporter substrate-binding protein [Marihabitans asiaticum]TWD17299.1 peptide/nickel transport system substrate-binding protein [Marihabitans asiaticum]